MCVIILGKMVGYLEKHLITTKKLNLKKNMYSRYSYEQIIKAHTIMQLSFSLQHLYTQTQKCIQT